MSNKTTPRLKAERWLTINDELVLVWNDGTESYIPLSRLRTGCPCASCGGESDLLGRVYKGPPQTLRAESFQIRAVEPIGGYALQPTWGDGHSTGLYTFDLLKRLGEVA